MFDEQIKYNIEHHKILTPSGWSDFSSIKKVKKENYVEIHFEDGQVFKCSMGHKLKLNDEKTFRPALDLNIEKDIVYPNKKIKEIKFKNEEIYLYDVQDVELNNEYFSSGLISHNCASIDKRRPELMQEIWGSAGPALTTVRGKAIMISTPRGQSGWYFNTYTNAKKMGFHIIDAHWLKHPIFSQGAYQWIEDVNDIEHKGYLKFLNDVWPDSIFDKEEGVFVETPKASYNFILDGKIRSPWYDFESTRLGPHLTKCELDCSFVGTGGEVLDAETMRELQVNVNSYDEFTTPFETVNGLFKEYKETIHPIPGHRYVIGADVATGDGEDFSAFSVIDIDTLEQCASFKCQLLPNTYADILYLVGKRFFFAVIVVENAGGGGTTLQDLKIKGYPRIYYSILKKNDPSSSQKKRKIGLWPSEQVRKEGGDRLEQFIRQNKLKVTSQELINEFHTWIWDKDGKRRHAPGKNDDLIMGTQHAIYYIFYVVRKGDISRKMFQNTFEIQKNGVSIVMPDANKPGGMFGRKRQEITPFRQQRYQVKPITNIDKESGMSLDRRMSQFL